MSVFLEPVYLNEKMVLNCAAYLFKGVSLESQETEQSSSERKGNLTLGFHFLQNLVSPVSAGGEVSRRSTKETKAARRYTLGGLHMVLLDELYERKDHLIIVEPSTEYSAIQESYVDVEAILKPIDFFTIIEMVKSLIPLVTQVLVNFGPHLKEEVFNEKLLSDIPRYEAVIKSVLQQLEDDYLRSRQLEMVMVDPYDPDTQC
jgi:hypothetical protein